LATFTHDLANAVDQAAGSPVSKVVPIRKERLSPLSGERVVYSIDKNERDSYRRAALFCNRHEGDLVSIQHEYGLYAGEWGEAILDFARACAKPLVTTLHTVPTNPEPKARQIIRELSDRSRKVVVMARAAVKLLDGVYGVEPAKVRLIPHGVHDTTFRDAARLRRALGIRGAPVLLTFGLLGPGKGIEYMVDALADITRRHPRAIYLVVGATHPAVKSEQGESYRERLVERAKRLGVWENIRFVDQFLSLNELLRYIRAADVFVSPYTGRDQIVSGTLAYALSAGRAIVATPYIYAEEIAAHGCLLLADFHSSGALAGQVLRILENPRLRASLQRKAWNTGRRMIWRSVGKRYYRLFREEIERERDAQKLEYTRIVPQRSITGVPVKAKACVLNSQKLVEGRTPA
jgi:glycosyltransferase involved in cell wall biosynthesis